MLKKITIILTSLVVIGALVFIILNLPSGTPEKAIMKYVLLKGNPTEAFNLRITPTNFEDKNYGKQFIVEGYYDNETGMEIRFFYLKKSDRGWYVETAGTGP
ncbi:hypothetical protein [Thermincola potens]|uniref:Uncharacterized protein n=1 Tax=Thermincola potens (strain JR) TaxID=635013 RepID=D5X799_THEPJ|nr:hypothetical protein [Thermincola potens]ADG82469.1 hypothetical protein TherJR_1618 [Thermincola potens JR]